MLRSTRSLLRVQSHQKNRSQTPQAGTRFGRVYNRGFVRYGFGGYGMSVYTPKKDRRFRVQPAPPPPTPAELGIGSPSIWAREGGLSTTTRALSPNFRAFALADSGVLFAHPTHQEIMRWGQKVLETETATAGSDGEEKRSPASMDAYVHERIEAILADNTLENVSLTHWRKNHMWTIVKSHAKMQRRWGVPDNLKGARTTLFNNK